MALLRPLLLDMRPNIQYMAAMALGRLAENSADLAAGVVTGDILPQVIYGIARNAVSGQSIPFSRGTISRRMVFEGPVRMLISYLQAMYKRASCFIMKSIAKHGPELAQAVVECGGAAAMVRHAKLASFCCGFIKITWKNRGYRLPAWIRRKLH